LKPAIIGVTRATGCNARSLAIAKFAPAAARTKFASANGDLNPGQ
jgi:hypothetical protein